MHVCLLDKKKILFNNKFEHFLQPVYNILSCAFTYIDYNVELRGDGEQRTTHMRIKKFDERK